MSLKRVLIRGPILSQSGYGEMARLALRSLLSQPDKFDVHVQAAKWGHSSWLSKRDEERQIIDDLITKSVHYFNNDGQIDATLQITIPNEWDHRINAVNIGYTAGIETDKVSPKWIHQANMMDGVIVISNHAKSSFESTRVTIENNKTGEIRENVTLATPISVVGMVPKATAPKSIDNLQLEYEFNFLSIAQWGPRKNLENTVKWWVEEFIDQEVGLILKTSIGGNSIIDKHVVNEKLKELLSEYPNRKCKVYLLHGDLEDSQLNWLYQNDKVKALISLSHGEGLGLPMLEAASNGLPIITTNWSGQTDFLINNKKKYFSEVKHNISEILPNAVWPGVLEQGTKWAYAEQGSYKMKLKDMKTNWKKYKKLATELQEIVNKRYTEQSIHSEFCNSVLQIIDSANKPHSV